MDKSELLKELKAAKHLLERKRDKNHHETCVEELQALLAECPFSFLARKKIKNRILKHAECIRNLEIKIANLEEESKLLHNSAVPYAIRGVYDKLVLAIDDVQMGRAETAEDLVKLYEARWGQQ